MSEKITALMPATGWKAWYFYVEKGKEKTGSVDVVAWAAIDDTVQAYVLSDCETELVPADVPPVEGDEVFIGLYSGGDRPSEERVDFAKKVLQVERDSVPEHSPGEPALGANGE